MTNGDEEHLPTWSDFTRDAFSSSDGTIRELDSYSYEGDPELVLYTADATVAESLVPLIVAMSASRSDWLRRATDAIVTAFSEGAPSSDKLDDAAADLVLQTIQAFPDGSIVVHFDDSCGEHFMEGYWPAVHFDAEKEITGVTVEA